MRKNGFTLAEVLLSMTIIGIIASITAPSLMNLFPNKDKVQTLKYKKLITEINAELLNNPSIYEKGEFDKDLPKDHEYSEIMKNEDYDKYQKMQRNKYAFFLMENLEIDENFKVEISNTKAIFKTIDGYEWTVETSPSGVPTTIMIDKNGTGIGDDSFGSATNQSPDRFKFSIDGDTGEAIKNDQDKITEQYLKNSNKLGNKKNDYNCAFNPEKCDKDLNN